MLSKEEESEVKDLMALHDKPLLRRYDRCRFSTIVPVFIGAIASSYAFFSLSYPWYVCLGIAVVYLAALCGCMYWLYCVRIQHFQHSIGPVEAVDECPKTHFHFHSLFITVTEQPMQHYTVDWEKPAVVQVGDVGFLGECDAVACIFMRRGSDSRAFRRAVLGSEGGGGVRAEAAADSDAGGEGTHVVACGTASAAVSGSEPLQASSDPQ